MAMKLYVLLGPVEIEVFRREFDLFIKRAKAEQWTKLRILFGTGWACSIYEDDWLEEILSPDELAARVAQVERDGHGDLGSNDLFVTPLALGVKFTFCHETDIHLEGPPDSEFIRAEAARYKAAGWSVHHRIVDTDIKYTDSRDKPPWEEL